MQISNIKIENIASFKKFTSDVDFKKTTLIFGTNGSGKSTFSSLLQLIDRCKSSVDMDEALKELKEYISSKVSKEDVTGNSKVSVSFNGNWENIEFNKNSDELSVENKFWSPVKVFNDKYTERTIGDSFGIDLRKSGIVIGEPNIELDKARVKKNGLSKKIENYEKKCLVQVDSAIKKYSELANSKKNVSDTISVKRLLLKDCEFAKDAASIKRRQRLGYETPEDNLQLISHGNLRQLLAVDQIVGLFNESIEKPELAKEQENLLLSFTDFYEQGIEAYSASGQSSCPFCFQEWDDSASAIERYKNFLTSTYNQKREIVKSTINRIEDVKKEIARVNDQIKISKPMVEEEGAKYDIDTERYKKIDLIPDAEESLRKLVVRKLDSMSLIIDVESFFVAIVEFYQASIDAANKVVEEIKKAISSIRTKRMRANADISKHLMWELWSKNKDMRADYLLAQKEVNELSTKVKVLEKKESNQDTIQTVFNGLIDFLGLSEYRIDSNKRLILKLDQDFDISNEGGRISSAQKKILSLCYFFAEIVSELDSPTDLKKYVLVFDDPVDSADYVYFHSITALIENLESILKLMLQADNVKIGQVIVFTHNSLLHDRLYKNFEMKKAINKIDNVTEITNTDRTINNYKLYLQYITRYYKNPKSDRKNMIFIGNLIRRVLEILANFNDLSNNDFSDYIVDIGKPKLALLSNHLSHESFTRVLNPLNSEVELQKACKELLEVIEACQSYDQKWCLREI